MTISSNLMANDQQVNQSFAAHIHFTNQSQAENIQIWKLLAVVGLLTRFPDHGRVARVTTKELLYDAYGIF